MSIVRGKLKKGFYISKRNEKVYISKISETDGVVLAGKKGKGAKKFKSLEEAYDFLDRFELRKKFKVIQVR